MTLDYKIAIIGCPAKPDIEWNTKNLQKLKDLGFNAVQLNIAWGARPADEPLNLEDVVSIPKDKAEQLHQSVPLRSDQHPQRCKQRKLDLLNRIKLCQETKLRSIFHFGAPYNGRYGYRGQKLENCIMDSKTVDRYLCLLDEFGKTFKGVDDILIYTFDQDAWLCSEFGDCENCRGLPLHQRVVPFINKLAQKWKKINPDGRLWWEPWELSAGQTLRCIESLEPNAVGLALHSNIAEVMATHPVDRWLRNACRLAQTLNIPVVVEAWLGGASEELQSFIHLTHPLVTLRQLQAIAQVAGINGIKEYFGLLPDKEDPNLRMTGLFFRNPDIEEEKALMLLAEPYGNVAKTVISYWRLCSEAMELFPWETSWYIRQFGKYEIQHSMDAAFIRGQQCATPSWESSRKAIFMKTDDNHPHPWMLEDVQLRCEMAAEKIDQALRVGTKLSSEMHENLKDEFKKGLEELDSFKKKTLSYVYHLRQTNLAFTMRLFRNEGKKIPPNIIREMLMLLKADQENQQNLEPIGEAIETLNENIDTFLETYFVEK